MTKPCRGIPSVLYENRYCNQDEFDIVICGGVDKESVSNEIIKRKRHEIKTSVKLIPMLNKVCSSKTVVIGSDIYVVGGIDQKHKWTSSFEKYSGKTKVWKRLKPFFYQRS